MKARLFASLLLLLLTITSFAQRVVDRLDRGLVAMKVSNGVFLSWRILGEEYYDVEYNVYRGTTKLNDTPLTVSNYTDLKGSVSDSYSVRMVVKGKEQPVGSSEVQPWAAAYKEIKLTHEGIKSTLVPNDACCADVDGDGELEIIMKFDNLSEMEQSYPKNGPKIGGVDTKEYTIFECLKMDGKRLWWINCGPNMGDFQNNEQNIAAYDWDGDGKAECVMRAADGTVVHMANGDSYTVGSSSVNVRAATGGGTNWFVTTDGEYLLYFNGETGEKYQQLPYPLKRLESGETDLNKAWGDGYGHRCSKHFFGAPYFDGKKPSIFLARGIYTRHKMIAYDVNPATHQLNVRWQWTCNTNGPWKGNGYHNYCVADVDWDGRDEIVFGSMVIDDNGKGLSTTGLGHGDAEHVGDLNPYIHGHEIYACLEDHPGNNYRDATTSKIYHRFVAGNDDGRCMAGNFTNSFPGGLGHSAREGAISLITNEAVSGLNATGVDQNFRIYWDGDLCEETFNGTGETRNSVYYPAEGCIHKYGSWTPIYTFPGSITNNYTKATPCYQGDLFGDWREEVIMRTAANNIRIYSTTTATSYRIPTLWHDHQYRNAMVWQMCGYNQPPRPSFYLGQIEGITQAPPPLIMTDRVEVKNGGTVSSDLKGKHVIVCETDNSAISLAQGVEPEVLTFNVPTWVQGTAPSECTTQNTSIKYTTYTCTVSGGSLAGNARLVKQGDGILSLPKTDFTHMGNTDIWAGTLNFDGSMKNSALWLNRFAELNANGATFKSVQADYGSVIRPGGADVQGTITAAESFSLGFGSRIVMDLFSAGIASDKIITKTLSIERKTGSAWINAGPQYLMPVIELVGHPLEGETRMAIGKYVIAEFEDELSGSANNLIVEGLPLEKKQLYVEDNRLILEILPVREAGLITWDGAVSNTWDFDITANFKKDGIEDATTFVASDEVVFNDEATSNTVAVSGSLLPASFTVNNTKAYTFKGTGSIDGDAKFVKEGTGIVTIESTNNYTGGNYLKGGTTKVSALANQYKETGNLGGITTSADKFTMENGAVLQTTAAVEMGSPMKMVGTDGGVLNNAADFRMSAALTGTTLAKKGAGCLYIGNSSLKRLIVEAGAVAETTNAASTVELRGGTLYDDAQCTSHAIEIPKGKSAVWQLTWTYYTAYANKLTGEGTITIVPRNNVSRVRIVGDWSQFRGTVKHTNKDIWLPLDASSGIPNGTLDIAEGCTVTNVCKSFAIGKLTGKGSLAHPVANFQNSSAVSGSNTWVIGNSDLGDFTFAGTFTDGGEGNKCIFNKVGTCRMNISGRSVHTGESKIQAGELHLATGSAIGKGALTVLKGATLSGNTGSTGLINSAATFNTGSTLQVGTNATATTGVINFGGGNVTMAKGSFLQIGISSPATASSTGGSSIQNINKLTMNGTIQLHYSSTAAEKFAVGDSILLWKNVTTVSGTPILEKASYEISAERGLYWDTSDIKRGILRVTDVVPAGIRSVKGDNDNKDIYTLDGRMVNEPRSGQLYIIKGQKIRYK